jgi:hypothetical protein
MLYVVFDTQKVPDTRRRRLGRNRRMVAAGQCGRVWALLEAPAVRAPLGGPERCFGATGRCREYRGLPLGGQNTRFHLRALLGTPYSAPARPADSH